MKIFLDGLSRLPAISIGGQALLIASMQIVEKYVDKAEFVMLSSYPEIEKLFFCNQPHKVEMIQRSKSQLGTVFDVRSIVKNVDAIVSAWGDGYITIPPHKIFMKTRFFGSGVPSVLFPSSIGPFSSGVLKRFLAKKGLGVFDKTMARDTITFKYLKEIGLKDVKLIPDTAFVLNPASNDRINEIFVKENVPRLNHYVGLNISQLLNRLYKQIGVSYPKFMADIVCHLNKVCDRHVLLVPHQICPSNNNVQRIFLCPMDDRDAINGVMNYVKDKEIASPILGEYNAGEYKGVISRCEIFIGGRMHSVIAAISSGIPSAIIQYSHKAGGVMEMCGLREYVWDFKAPKQDFLKIIDKLWYSRVSLQSELQGRMMKIKENAWKSGELLVEALKEYKRI